MADSPIIVLLIEDNPGDARLIREMLAALAGAGQTASFRLIHAGRLADGLAALVQTAADVVLLDLSLPDSQGLDTFLRVRAAAPETPVVVLTGLEDEQAALKAIQAGAQDYLVKGQVDGSLLGRALRYAIERKRAEVAQARRERELATLYATSLELNSQADLALLLPTIVQRAAELAGVTMGGLYLLRDDGQSLELVVSHNLPQNYVGAVLQLGEGVSGQIAQTGEPLVVEDYDHWPGRPTIYADSSFRRVLGVPLKVQDRVIGVLNITDDRQTGAFDQDQIRFVRLFADQAAIAVENARLYEQVQRYATSLEARVAERTAELQVANERLLGLERLKSQFIANASHELRTPLTNIKTSLYLLERGKPEKREKYLTVLNNETELLQSLLDDLLDAASLDFGRAQPAPAPVDIGLLLAKLVETRVALVAERNLWLDLVADPATPPVLADAKMLRQAIKVLLLDIADHEAAGSRIVFYTQPFTAAGRAWGVLTAGGDAPAPTPEEQARIFALASAEEEMQDNQSADTNLRLAVCREIVTRHGGRVAVQPRTGRSSIVTLWLPAA